jgi:hypothetical protein
LDNFLSGSLLLFVSFSYCRKKIIYLPIIIFSPVKNDEKNAKTGDAEGIHGHSAQRKGKRPSASLDGSFLLRIPFSHFPGQQQQPRGIGQCQTCPADIPTECRPNAGVPEERGH